MKLLPLNKGSYIRFGLRVLSYGMVCIFSLAFLAVESALAQTEFVSLLITAPPTTVQVGSVIQLTVEGTRGDGTTADLTLGSSGTTYLSLDGNATISPDGLVTVVGSNLRSTLVTDEIGIVAANDELGDLFLFTLDPTDSDGNRVRNRK